jgi:hypothetical protein
MKLMQMMLDPAGETGQQGRVSCRNNQRKMEVSGRRNQNEGGMIANG